MSFTKTFSRSDKLAWFTNVGIPFLEENRNFGIAFLNQLKTAVGHGDIPAAESVWNEISGLTLYEADEMHTAGVHYLGNGTVTIWDAQGEIVTWTGDQLRTSESLGHCIQAIKFFYEKGPKALRDSGNE